VRPVLSIRSIPVLSLLAILSPLQAAAGTPAASVVTPSSGVVIDSTPPPTAVTTQPAQRADAALPAAATRPAAEVADAPTSRPAAAEHAPPTLLRRGTAIPRESAAPASPWYRSSLVALAAIIGLIVLVSYAVRRYMPGVRALGGSAVRVLQRTPLSSKQSLALVQIGQRLVLIGITPERISSLAVIEDAEECARLRARAGTARVAGDADFGAALSREADKFERAPVEAGLPRAESTRRLQDTQGQLEGMLQKLKGLRVG
jgi:flagellar biogenesis protein FliO